MAINVDSLVKQAKRQVGTDAYIVYPNSLREIPDPVLWGFASACLLEFVKAFVDFKGLGERAHKQVTELLSKMRERKGFEEFCRSEGLDASVAETLKLIPQPTTDQQLGTGVASLEKALTEVGMSSTDANLLAQKISQTVKTAADRKA